MGGIDILLSVRENASDQFLSIHNSNKTLQKGLEGTEAQLQSLEKKQESLRRSMGKLAVTMEDAGKTLKEAKKAYRENADEINRTNLEHASEQYQKVREEMRSLQKESKATQNAMAELNITRSKMENQAGGIQGNSIMAPLMKAGIAKMAGDTISQFVQFGISSALGSEAGGLFSGAISGAVSGASIGAAFTPAAALAGGLIGGAIGTVQSGISYIGKQDDAFKQVVKDQYNSTLEGQQASLASGSALAATRERDQLAFSSLLGGSETAEDYLAWTRKTANFTPFLYGDLTAMSKTLATYKYTPEEMQDLLIKIGDTGANLGLDSSGMNAIATYLGRMKSSGKTSLEYINPLVERGIPAVDYLAEALGKSKMQVYDMVSKGLIPGADAARIIADAMGEANQGAMELQSGTFAGLMSTAEGLQQEMDAAMGEGYNNYLKPYLQERNEMLQGEFGEQLMEGNRLIGEYQAKLKADQLELLTQAQQEAMESDAYQKAILEENGAEAGRILMEAQVEAENKFRNSEGYQLYLQSQKTMLSNMRADLADGWKAFGYDMGQEFSKGLLASPIRSTMFGLSSMSGEGADGLYGVNPFESTTTTPVQDAIGKGNALSSIVGAVQNVANVSGTFYIREEADVDKVANQIFSQMVQAFQLGVETPLP
ncbi:tape measure protein [Merdimmobilis hominis]|uniref:tape measure protein n=1 Tax=Merdimmobilis hominis TaxID=2897707 RepID=UPI0035151E83